MGVKQKAQAVAEQVMAQEAFVGIRVGFAVPKLSLGSFTRETSHLMAMTQGQPELAVLGDAEFHWPQGITSLVRRSKCGISQTLHRRLETIGGGVGNKYREDRTIALNKYTFVKTTRRIRGRSAYLQVRIYGQN